MIYCNKLSSCEVYPPQIVQISVYLINISEVKVEKNTLLVNLTPLLFCKLVKTFK